MQPHLVRWEQAYRGKDLTILYVADGGRVTPQKLQDSMREAGAHFPLVHDTSATTTQAYGVRAYPTAYVVGRDGTVVWEGIPHYDPREPQKAIDEALATSRRGTSPR